jgi:hypothetical protein
MGVGDGRLDCSFKVILAKIVVWPPSWAGRATLDGWVIRVAELLEPVVRMTREDLLTATYLQQIFSPVPALVPV